MPILTLLSPFIGKLIGVLAAVGGLVAVYFSVKHKGVLEERARVDKAHVELERKVAEATTKDADIDANAKEQIDEIRKANQVQEPKPGSDVFRF